mmetsp:Transcript_17134/g.41065  ORF Transcript_17134/g.41065 Transcript_17134/m.41065 type:complete len:243 (-) Transcript_17134:104-832(-)
MALGVVEVRGHGDHGAVDRPSQVPLGVGPELRQYHGADLLRRVIPFHPPAADVDRYVRPTVLLDDVVRHEPPVLLHGSIAELSSDQTLHVENGVLGIDRRLILGRVAHELTKLFLLLLANISIICVVIIIADARDEGDVARRDAIALIVRYDFHLSGFRRSEDPHAAVGGAEVDADDGARPTTPLLLLPLGATVVNVIGTGHSPSPVLGDGAARSSDEEEAVEGEGGQQVAEASSRHRRHRL